MFEGYVLVYGKKRAPRFHMHFTPTSSSWLNLVERFFAHIINDAIRDGSFRNVRQLVEAMEMYLAERNLKPKPYKWKADGEAILRKVKKAKAWHFAEQIARKGGGVVI